MPPIQIEPLSGESSVPMRFSKVVLPDPEGPVIATVAPTATSRSIPFKTGTTPAGPGYPLATPLKLNKIGLGICLVPQS